MSSNETVVPFVGAGPVLAAAIALPVIGAGVVALRFWVRLSRQQGLAGDDWAILAALPCLTGMGIMLIWGIAKKSVGYPSEPYPVHKATAVDELLTETTPKQVVTFIVYWVVWLIMVPTNGLIKISATLLYRRMFVVNRRDWVDLITLFMLVVCVVWTVGFFLAQIFGCGRHFKNPFGTLDEIAVCHTNIRYNALMITDLITDILVWLIPFAVIYALRMARAKKVGAVAILSLAAGSLAAAIIRLIVELDIASGGYANPINLDLTLTLNLYYSMIESGIALVAACLPMTCMPLLRLVVPGRVTKAAKRGWSVVSAPRHRRRFAHDLDTYGSNSVDKEFIEHIHIGESSSDGEGQGTNERSG